MNGVSNDDSGLRGLYLNVMPVCTPVERLLKSRAMVLLPRDVNVMHEIGLYFERVEVWRKGNAQLLSKEEDEEESMWAKQVHHFQDGDPMHNYILIPLAEVAKTKTPPVLLHRSSSETETETIHTYPYADFPIIQSPVNPFFVFLSALVAAKKELPEGLLSTSNPEEWAPWMLRAWIEMDESAEIVEGAASCVRAFYGAVKMYENLVGMEECRAWIEKRMQDQEVLEEGYTKIQDGDMVGLEVVREQIKKNGVASRSSSMITLGSGSGSMRSSDSEDRDQREYPQEPGVEIDEAGLGGITASQTIAAQWTSKSSSSP
ncbi:hypothetical protein DL96DRAFT_814735 [Flagelloscypha sp. PMI_526]|nr:hypothetical protein DL96DRAFT_814735 [Flagelloscypha sp. PMI_526]